MEDFDVRAAVLVGGTRAVVWDTLAHPRQLAGVAALVGPRPVTVVYSHADWDHAWGTGGLGRVDEVVAHGVAAHRFRTDVPEELARRRTATPGAWDDVVPVPPTRTFRTHLTLDLGGVALELHALPGHTPDCLVGYVPAWGVLLAGDTVETPLPVVNDGAAVEGWVARLRAWTGVSAVTTVVPSHGRVGGLELLDETLAYLDGLARGAPRPAGVLTSFYDETHRRNVAAVRAATAPQARGTPGPD
ncbi:MAG TPA: MBL fold metallo-hydrolase [Longimicrobiales bacterium]|nr:MBL fold metallo-hydrolase [Longimicrobiales bacterium]